MNRLTKKGCNGKATYNSAELLEIINRLALIEDILGDNYDLDSIQKLIMADKDGRIAVLPCKRGDKLYCINDYDEIEEVKALGFFVGRFTSIYYREREAWEDYNMPLGSVLFLTYEEAKRKKNRYANTF